MANECIILSFPRSNYPLSTLFGIHFLYFQLWKFGVKWNNLAWLICFSLLLLLEIVLMLKGEIPVSSLVGAREISCMMVFQAAETWESCSFVLEFSTYISQAWFILSQIWRMFCCYFTILFCDYIFSRKPCSWGDFCLVFQSEKATKRRFKWRIQTLSEWFCSKGLCFGV